MALTQANVDRLAHEGASWTWIADDGKRGLGSGFGLRVYKSGAKSFALRYRTAGRLRFYTIGKASILYDHAIPLIRRGGVCFCALYVH